tara:strand:+ start:1231 stop:1482 length:252 start_codon:yes stop_codon:yes gene_type:complete
MLQCEGCGGIRKYKYISKKVENITKEKYRALRKSRWFYNEENDVWKKRVKDLDNWDHTCNCHQGCLPTLALLALSSITLAFII